MQTSSSNYPYPAASFIPNGYLAPQMHPQISPSTNVSNIPPNLLPHVHSLQSPTNYSQGKCGETQTKTKEFKVKCGFCGKLNHTYAECRQRKNTPYCETCTSYGHTIEVCPKSRVLAVQPTPKGSKCLWCGRLGHSEENCSFKRFYEKKKSGNGQGSGSGR